MQTSSFSVALLTHSSHDSCEKSNALPPSWYWITMYTMLYSSYIASVVVIRSDIKWIQEN